MGIQPRLRHAAKAKPAPKAMLLGQGSPMGTQPRPRHAATAKAASISWLPGHAAAMVNAGHHGDVARVKVGLLP